MKFLQPQELDISNSGHAKKSFSHPLLILETAKIATSLASHSTKIKL
jgi:hypothetical protein